MAMLLTLFSPLEVSGDQEVISRNRCHYPYLQQQPDDGFYSGRSGDCFITCLVGSEKKPHRYHAIILVYNSLYVETLLHFRSVAATHQKHTNEDKNSISSMMTIDFSEIPIPVWELMMWLLNPENELALRSCSSNSNNDGNNNIDELDEEKYEDDKGERSNESPTQGQQQVGILPDFTVHNLCHALYYLDMYRFESGIIRRCDSFLAQELTNQYLNNQNDCLSYTKIRQDDIVNLWLDIYHHPRAEQSKKIVIKILDEAFVKVNSATSSVLYDFLTQNEETIRKCLILIKEDVSALTKLVKFVLGKRLSDQLNDEDIMSLVFDEKEHFPELYAHKAATLRSFDEVELLISNTSISFQIKDIKSKLNQCLKRKCRLRAPGVIKTNWIGLWFPEAGIQRGAKRYQYVLSCKIRKKRILMQAKDEFGSCWEIWEEVQRQAAVEKRVLYRWTEHRLWHRRWRGVPHGIEEVACQYTPPGAGCIWEEVGKEDFDGRFGLETTYSRISHHPPIRSPFVMCYERTE